MLIGGDFVVESKLSISTVIAVAGWNKMDNATIPEGESG